MFGAKRYGQPGLIQAESTNVHLFVHYVVRSLYSYPSRLTFQSEEYSQAENICSFIVLDTCRARV